MVKGMGNPTGITSDRAERVIGIGDMPGHAG